jgi:NAD(P)-dependent dehydrogenase (short-subunit alcohol dehydrogenase family)
MTSAADGRELGGKVAVVTGGGSGIGRATCVALAQCGASVVVVGLTTSRVAETVAAVEQVETGNVIGLTLDVRSEPDMAVMAQSTLRHFGRIDVLVASAGLLRGRGVPPRLVRDMSSADWESVIDTNLRGVFLSNRAVLPAMIAQRRGDIINVSSGAALRGRAFDAAYCASKSAVCGFSAALAEEVRDHRIRVQVVLPGPVATPMLQEQNGPLPMPRHLLSSERVANVILHLLRHSSDAVASAVCVQPFAAAGAA